jgi:hypothetical protein
MALLVASVQAAQPGPADSKITVYVENDANVPSPVVSSARTIAGDMFASIGVQINWRAGTRSDFELRHEKAIAIRLTLETPGGFGVTTGAFTVPTEGVHITVLYNRLAWSRAKPGLTAPLLAHVFVHEITHILEGVARHSETGVMKANWSSSDYYKMQTKTLAFAPEDVELIHRGLANRNAQEAAPLAANPNVKISPAK